jgi:hypothetical protein
MSGGQRVSGPVDPESLSTPLAPAPSRRTIDLVVAYGVAQWKVVQAWVVNVSDEQFREAKERQVAAYRALMEYIGRLERSEDEPR